MIEKIIDSHIHLDMYREVERKKILASLIGNKVEALITVSNNLESAKINLELANSHKVIKPAFGFHPEQMLPTLAEMEKIYYFIEKNHHQMVAIGEVGLPYYLKRKNPQLNILSYLGILEEFILLAKKYNKPIILHAIYEDAETTCDLLEKHEIKRAHFHWFKGIPEITNRIALNGYYISVTPDVLYEPEIATIVKDFPITQLMVETDGPWQFTGPYKNKITEPNMIHDVIKKIASIKNLSIETVYQKIYQNTVEFYQLT